MAAEISVVLPMPGGPLMSFNEAAANGRGNPKKAPKKAPAKAPLQ